MLTIKYDGKEQSPFIQRLIDLSKNKTKHVLFTSADFTPKEVDRSELAKQVVVRGYSICKLCGAAESELTKHSTCSIQRAYLLFSRHYIAARPELTYLEADKEAKSSWQKHVLPLLK